MPSVTGSLVRTAACAIEAEPIPASFEMEADNQCAQCAACDTFTG